MATQAVGRRWLPYSKTPNTRTLTHLMAAQEEIQLWQTAPPAMLLPKISDKTQQQSVLIAARQNPGYVIAAGQVGHAIVSRASHLLLDYSQAACSMRYQIDGQWEQLPPLPRDAGDAMLIAFKQVCQLNPADRRSAQAGKCDVKIQRDKFVLTMQSQGIPTGERVLIKIEAEKIPFSTLADLGMRDAMIDQFRALLNSEGSTVVISSPKAAGLTTTWQVAINAADRLIRDFQSVEPESEKEPEIININPNFYGGSTGLSPSELMRKIILKEPDVFLFPTIPDDRSLQMGLEQTSKNEKQVIARFAATTAVEAAAKIAAQFPESAKLFAATMKGVLNQRIVRRLCENCKVSYQPPPALLQRLGIPAGRVTVLYQPFIPPPIEQQVDANGKPAPIQPCHVCQGRGYYGRVAIFELLTPGDKFRAALVKTQDVAQLSMIAKEEGHRSLQAEGVLTVARGLTGLDELKRVFT
jgi:type II secretory ATPase GspE/PulE/Tfp pilus assembly ATPase PilB-like protein